MAESQNFQDWDWPSREKGKWQNWGRGPGPQMSIPTAYTQWILRSCQPKGGQNRGTPHGRWLGWCSIKLELSDAHQQQLRTTSTSQGVSLHDIIQQRWHGRQMTAAIERTLPNPEYLLMSISPSLSPSLMELTFMWILCICHVSLFN